MNWGVKKQHKPDPSCSTRRCNNKDIPSMYSHQLQIEAICLHVGDLFSELADKKGKKKIQKTLYTNKNVRYHCALHRPYSHKGLSVFYLSKSYKITVWLSIQQDVPLHTPELCRGDSCSPLILNKYFWARVKSRGIIGSSRAGFRWEDIIIKVSLVCDIPCWEISGYNKGRSI
ncbi:hypothetical protein AMECASPLE_031432 [Ameca splendens]|uniref:Uncharacterized protein n=1 Tax=Ameca splendens TaxID=208324 RepID=A0ABV1A1Q5_9TELE